MYDVNEIELSTVHQVETSSNNELGVQEDDGLDECNTLSVTLYNFC